MNALPCEEEEDVVCGATANEIETVPLIPSSSQGEDNVAMSESPPATAAWTDNEMPGAGKEPPVPPSYEMATSLPSYEEAEQSKQEEMERMQREEPSQQSPPLWHGLGRIE